MDRRISRRTLMKAGVAQAAALVVASACGSSSSTPTAATQGATGASTGNSAGGAAAAAAATPVPTVVKQTGSAVKIVYWGSYSGTLGQAEQEVVRRFNASQSDVVLDYQFQGSYEETAQKLTQALAARQAPDVVLLSDVWWFKFYLNKTLAPMNDFIKANGVDTADYVDSLYQEGVRNGNVYWLPFARSTPIFYYNKQVWAEAGLPDRGPETWDEFLGWVPKLVKKNGSTVSRSAFAHPNAGSYIAWLFQPVTWQFGGSYSDPDFTIRITEPPAVEAGDFYRSSTVDGWASTPKDAEGDFSNGLTAAVMASTGSMAGIKKTAKFEFGTAFLPKKKQFGCDTGGAGLAVLAGSPQEKQAAAFKYIEFATSPAITAYWSQTTGYMPVRKSASETPEMQSFYQRNPNFKTAVDQLKLTRPQDAARVFIPNGDQIIGKGLERITVNQEETTPVFGDVAKTLQDAAAPVIAALKQLG